MGLPKAHASDWTLSLDMQSWKGDVAGDPQITFHEDEMSAIRYFNTMRAILGPEWYKMEAWIIPPKGSGRPKRHFYKVQPEYKTRPPN